MYLSKLELHGFKSFAERTVLQFDPGITAIVGPNGCGKSNIVDAVRWVIGEQRARVLRSEKMENVIFNGTSRRRPVGMAEVLLTVENTRGVLPTEYSEVTLGRRLYRSGDSDYLLNNTPCRLKDITDLFMDTGMGAGAYSVIELKMVEEILSENAQDRRRLFEEAAGITRYKLRRKQTLGKLDSTQVDLNRVRDLTDEVEKQVRSLKRQAEKAARHREYTERLHRLELALARIEYVRLSGRLTTLESELEKSRTSIASLEDRERVADAALARRRQNLEEAEAALKQAREELAGHVAAERALEAEQRLLLERLDAAHRERERLRTEDGEDAARRTDLESQRRDLEDAIAGAEPASAQASQALDVATGVRDEAQQALTSIRSRLDAARREERSLEERRTAAHRRHDRQSARLEFLIAESDRLTTDRKTVETTIQEAGRRAEGALERFESTRGRVEKARTEVASILVQKDSAQKAVDEARSALRELEKAREGASAERMVLENLVASFEEFPDAVRFLAENAEDDSPPVTVADVLSAPVEIRSALEAALGSLASAIIVRTTADVSAAAAKLEASERGRATFIVLDRIDPSMLPGRSAESFEALLDSVDFPSEYAVVARLLLGDALITESRPADIRPEQIPAGFRIVTRDGETVTASGIIHTGSRHQATSALAGRIARREQLESVRSRLDNLEERIVDQSKSVAELQAAIASIEVEPARDRLRQAERALSEAEKEEARASFERETAEKRLREHSGRLQAIEDERNGIQAEIAREAEELMALESSVAKARDVRTVHEASFREAEEATALATSGFNEANVAAVQARNRLQNLRLDLERSVGALQILADREAARRRQFADLEERVSAWQESLDELRARTKSTAESHRPAAEAVEASEARVGETKSAIAAEDEQLRGIRLEREAAMRHESGLAVQRAEVQTRLEDLVASVQEDMSLDLGQALSDSARENEVGVLDGGERLDIADLDEREARVEVQDLRQKIRSIGAVNELALESYQEEKERLDFLVEQQRDLENAEKTLLETIKEINSTASRRFLETYEAIHDSFKRIFVELFGEDASAELSLVDASDPLETAIEITAKPRGKRPSTIAQLSGGEKTLTAIALLFAIYLVKPSPFCILDEVDAPLDDANVERFMSLIRTFSNDTQFILVTHNKRTMEAADRLYGITMQEQGVSKLVGVRFEEAVDLVEGAS
jgi:chromosome segregation protein